MRKNYLIKVENVISKRKKTIRMKASLIELCEWQKTLILETDYIIISITNY